MQIPSIFGNDVANGDFIIKKQTNTSQISKLYFLGEFWFPKIKKVQYLKLWEFA